MTALTQEFKTEWLKKNEKLLHRIASKFRYTPPFDYTELLQIVKMYAWQALNKYTTEKGESSGCKISTYVYTNTLGYVQLEYSRNARPYRIQWKDISTHPQPVDFDVLNTGEEADPSITCEFTDEYIDTQIVKQQIKETLTPLEYEILLSEFDLDQNYQYNYTKVIEIVKPTLYPLILVKIRPLLKKLL